MQLSLKRKWAQSDVTVLHDLGLEILYVLANKVQHQDIAGLQILPLSNIVPMSQFQHNIYYPVYNITIWYM